MELRGAALSSSASARSKSQPPQTQDDGDPQSAHIRRILIKYLAEIEMETYNMAKEEHRNAAIALATRPKPILNKFDLEDPFKDMKPISIEGTRPSKGADFFNIKAIHKKRGEVFVTVPEVPIEVPTDTPMFGKGRAYTTLRRNLITEDEPELSYQPYTEEDDPNEEEGFKKMEAQREESMRMESSGLYATFIHEFLEEINVSMDAIVQYLVGDISHILGRRDVDPAACILRRDAKALPIGFNQENPDISKALQSMEHVRKKELLVAEKVCIVFMNETKISLWEVWCAANTLEAIERERAAQFEAIEREQAAQFESDFAEQHAENAMLLNLDSYTSLDCPSCHMHDCPFHSFGSEDDSDSILDDSEGEEYGCASQIPGWSWSGPQASKELPLDTPDEPCSELCFKAVPPKLNESDTVEWSKEQMALIDTFASVLRNNPRFSCLLVPAINETCVNIYKRLKAGGLLALVDVPILEEVITSNPAQNTKRKKSFFSKNVKSNRHTTSLPGYPSNTNKTHLHDQRSYVQQCRHSGPCANDSTCKCVRQHVTCEKFCACPVDCPRRWRGCSCKAENLPCSSDKCICIRAGRECDADLCGSCGARELLDPTNRGDESMLTDYRCKNIDLQFGCPVYTIHGHSAVSGMGLFVAKNVAKGGYLGEYVGEILTDAESERRGALYDKNHLSYLFGLNKDRTIDATRQGNKFRFINHSTTRPNCHARIVLANCTHRIGFYSLRALKAGEELFFDYGYGKTESLKFVPHELPPVPSVSKEGNVSKKNKEKGKANSKKSEGKQEKRKAASRTSFRLSNSRTATATNSAYSASDEEEDEVVVLESDDEPLVAMAKRRPLRRRLSATSGGPRPKRMR